MDEGNVQSKLWSSTQVYIFATVSLLMGIAVGYLFHAPKPAVASAPQLSRVAESAAPEMPSPEQMKRMADKQVQPLLAALQQQPNDAGLLARVAGAYLAAQQFPSAAQYYERSVALKPDATNLTQLASCYYFGGDGEKAIVTLQHALQVDPKHADALFNLGMLQWRVKSDPKSAIALWERLLKTNPHHPKRAQVEQAIAQAKQHLNIPPGAKTGPAM